MIRIRRTSSAPAVLRTKGKNKRRGHSLSYTANPAAYDSGALKFEFDGDIYAHDDVKAVLKAMQHDKCAFCESKVSHIAYGDVEHYRPKGGFRQHQADVLGRPGYYWLAYEWDNLLFSCQLCNQRFKKNLFPLIDPAARARNHKDALRREAPVMVDPSKEDPADYIGFRAEVAYGLDGTGGRGEQTLNALGLNRVELVEVRRDKLKYLHAFGQIVRTAADHPQNAALREVAERAQQQLDRAVHDSAEFAGMVRGTVADLGG
ncbi:hypothetical protein [uncultured Thiohalocapsa sp.]|uniref:hypothetical protein n=1 Tax=uncultured Thiohalocapsa sp. TaxID=768990 RepID=UPI0025D0A93D|nr:hypothetical protein [uncultured Thiohalocapsa sp.]